MAKASKGANHEHWKRYKNTLNKNRRLKRAQDPEYHREQNRRWYNSHPESRLLMWARRRANRKALPFSITVKDVVIPDVCPILGIPLLKELSRKIKYGSENSPSLDRIVLELGYVPGNVLVISNRANRIKNSGTAEEHRKIAAWMDEH